MKKTWIVLYSQGGNRYYNANSANSNLGYLTVDDAKKQAAILARTQGVTNVVLYEGVTHVEVQQAPLVFNEL